MSEFLFFIILIGGLLALFSWAFRVLTQEQWQFLAIVPLQSQEGHGGGTTLTYYGVFTACAVSFAITFLVLLLGAIGKSLMHVLCVVIPLVVLTVPSAKIIARFVEGKPSTLTIGGASFIGMLAAPWVILAGNGVLPALDGMEMPMVPTLAALWIAYAFGEGMGRLACISFGCCYGKPLSDCHPVLQRIFKSMAFQFAGKTKKAAYAGQLEGIPLFPIQGVTALVNSALGVMGTVLYLRGWYYLALALVALGTQGWRIISELFRVDHRGNGLVSVYQWMALSGALYSIVLGGLWMESDHILPHIADGFGTLWDVHVLLVVQVFWLGIFFFTGVSRVTRANISTEVCYDRV